MSDQAERLTDPWATVELVRICHGYDSFYYEFDAVDKARAADAAQIANLTAEVEKYDAMRAAYMATKNAEADTLRAERDEAHRELHERDERDQNLLWKAAHDLLEAQNDSLRAERDLLTRGVATVTFGDADAVIAKVVAERDAAQQEIARLKEDRALNIQFYAITIDQRNKAWAENEALTNALRAFTE